MLEFFDDNEKIGVATIYDRHILFNSKLIKYFDLAYRVRIAVDKELKKIHVFLIDKDYALSGEVSSSSLLSVSVSKSYVRIASKNMVKFIQDSFNLVIDKGKSVAYKAIYDEIKKEIVIDVGGDD